MNMQTPNFDAKILHHSKHKFTMGIVCPSACLYVCMSVCMSGLGGNMIFSAPIKDRALIFSVYIPLVYEHLFYKYCGGRSVGQATKGKRASLLIDVVILVSLKVVFTLSPMIIQIVLMLTYSSSNMH